MLIYLSKKVAIPNGVKLKCLSWNSEQGWIACGGDNGLLKVLKLDGVARKDSKGATAASSAASNLSMNQTLEGHSGAVLVTCWNENYRKLTTSDQQGLIIVWMLHKGMWFEEMINNRNKSIVRDMQWTADGQKICIVYEDGAVIVGSVDGNRLWGKELDLQLALVEWSPDGRLILFCTVQGECHVHDNIGNPLTKLPLCVPEQPPGAIPIIGIDWYHGLEGYTDPNAPTLAVAFENGRLQLMRHEADEEPLLVNCGMRAARIAWNSNGTVLAVSGTLPPGTSDGKGDAKETPAVQFYSNQGALLRTLRVPGSGIASLSWEGGGLRVALAVDSFIYFANVRPDYKWGYFNNTCVYAHVKADRSEQCVTFWDTGSNEKYCKYVQRLMGIRAAGDHCVLAARGEDAGQYVVVLCDAIGSPLETRYIDVEPRHITMTQTLLAVASEEWVWAWQYRSAPKGANAAADAGAASTLKPGKEWKFRIDDVAARRSSSMDTGPDLAASTAAVEDPIACLCASDTCLVLGRASGSVQHYSLPAMNLQAKYALRGKPQALALNCESTRMSVIDANGVLTLYDIDGNDNAAGGSGRLVADFERKDVWDMRWADDNPELLAVMEKAKMYIFRGTDPEEPVNSTGYLCTFTDLEIKAVSLEDIMRKPDAPEGDHLLHLETKSLRDLRAILADASLADSYQFVEEHAHPRLWKLLAEHALEKLDWATAEKAFVRVQDYYGIQFVKRLQLLDEREKQAAEVAVYFRRFDEAERIYDKLDRPDLAIQLRSKLGDWFKVEKLLQAGGGDDSQLTTAWNRIGDYYTDRQKWGKAAQYYAQAKNTEALVQCFYVLENWAGLEKLIATLPEGSPLLGVIGERFASVGICEHATTAFLRAGDVKAAIECCVVLNQWDRVVRLAEQQRSGHIEALLAKYANHLLDKGKQLQAIELYRRADHHSDAARLLSALTRDAAAAKASPQRVKKLYILAALEAEEFRKKTLSLQGSAGTTKSAAAATLEGLIQHDQATGLDRSLAGAWHGAEGWHLWLLAHRQLYAGNADAAMKTALRLHDYEDVLSSVDVASLVALTAFYSRHYQQCSQAFIRLESHPDLPAAKQEAFADLALNIFADREPEDPLGRAQACPLCRGPVQDWSSRCPTEGCEATFPVCVASGRSIISEDRVKCRTCKHLMILSELGTTQSCPLCHAALDENKQRTSHQKLSKSMR